MLNEKTTIKIDKNMPYHPKGHGGISWPFADMKIGDSFEVPETSDISTCRSAASHYGNRSKTGIKFSFRKRRCWRIK